jgi:uncharacterized protein (TIGR00299 family) protein
MTTHVHLDMLGGLAGDMFLAAAIDSGLIDPEPLEDVLGSLGLGDVRIIAEETKRGAIAGTHVHFEGWDPSAESDHRHLSSILDMLDDADLDADTREVAKEMFRTLGRAEATIHDMDLERVHFHECGALDSIFDFVSAAWIIAHADATWSCSPVPTGSGTIETDHGTVPIPAPATMRLLDGFETVSRSIGAELVTPTGATILSTLAERFPGMQRPPGRVTRSGYGAGSRELDDLSNVVRMVVLETDESWSDEPSSQQTPLDAHREPIVRLVCDIDDATPEMIASAADTLRNAGALDVTTEPIGMKKQRTGIRLAVLARPDDEARLARQIFKETTTFGIRTERTHRYALNRSHEMVDTDFGEVPIKIGRLNGEVVQRSPEFNDCRRLADTHDVAAQTVYRAALAALD